MNIILIGYRGSGKTAIGKLLADQLWKTFADVDAETCKHFKSDSIADIWKRHGEPAWRQQEAAVAQALCAKKDHVIALGGGTLTLPAARAAVEAADATRIYLKCAPEELLRRVSQDPRHAAARPHLTPLGGGLDEIRAVLAQREPIYLAVADKTFDVTHVNVKDAVRYLIDRCLRA